MKSIPFCLFLPIVIMFNLKAEAAVYSNGSGNWNSSSTWVKNGNATLPACGDTIYIETNTTVTVTSQESYIGCTTPLYIYVKGTLQFTNGNKLDLPCGSFVNIQNGGLVKKATAGGGNSTLISICNVTFWNAAAGPLTGPVYLPVSLLNFDATKMDEAVWFNWSTASEVNNDYFLVQRAADALRYHDIGRVKGAGNSNTIRSYSDIDNDPAQGLNYYRLCQVDFNGAGYCYKPRAVLIKKKSKVMVFPNPATNAFISLIFESEGAGLYSFEVRNINGALVFKKENLQSDSGYNVLGINKYYHFEKGIYIVSVEIEHAVYQQKLVVTE